MFDYYNPLTWHYDELSREQYPTYYPIHLAAEAGNLAAVQRMLERGDSPNASMDESGDTKPLHIAILTNRPDMVSLLLQHGADAEARNWVYEPNSTPLTMAMALGRTEIMRALLAGGADPNACNDKGEHPLCLAISLNNQEVLDTLLESPDLHLDAPDDGGAPGMFGFIARREYEAAARLLELGADPNASAPGSGNTPLHAAARENLADLVQLLLLYGAHPLVRNKRGELPQELTQNETCLALLRAATEKLQQGR